LTNFRRRGVKIFLPPKSKDYDLVDNEAVKRLYRDANPDVVIHLAAVVGGIGSNRANPGSFFYKNLVMGVQMMEQGRVHEIEKFVAIGTVCAYPQYTPVPFKEENLWAGYPEQTNAPYGLAKKYFWFRQRLIENNTVSMQFTFCLSIYTTLSIILIYHHPM